MLSLDLSSNDIGVVGAKALGEMLALLVTIPQHHAGSFVRQGLHTLRLSRNRIGDRGAAHLAQAIMGCCSWCLRHLHLANNGIGMNGARRFMDALEHNYHIKEVDLGQQQDNNVIMKIDFYLRLNKVGRRRMLTTSHSLPDAHWATLLGKVKDDPIMLFYLLRQKPDLCKVGRKKITEKY